MSSKPTTNSGSLEGCPCSLLAMFGASSIPHNPMLVVDAKTNLPSVTPSMSKDPPSEGGRDLHWKASRNGRVLGEVDLLKRVFPKGVLHMLGFASL